MTVFESLAKSSSQITTSSLNDGTVRTNGVWNSNFFPVGGSLSPCSSHFLALNFQLLHFAPPISYRSYQETQAVPHVEFLVHIILAGYGFPMSSVLKRLVLLMLVEGITRFHDLRRCVTPIPESDHSAAGDRGITLLGY